MEGLHVENVKREFILNFTPVIIELTTCFQTKRAQVSQHNLTLSKNNEHVVGTGYIQLSG